MAAGGDRRPEATLISRQMLAAAAAAAGDCVGRRGPWTADGAPDAGNGKTKDGRRKWNGMGERKAKGFSFPLKSE
jgi:hypothetical protein